MFARLFQGMVTTWQEFSNDSDFYELRKDVDPEFERTFSYAYRAYIKGDWHTAGKHLSELIKQCPEDGPTKNLNKIVNTQNNGKCPEGWKGFRELTSK